MKESLLQNIYSLFYKLMEEKYKKENSYTENGKESIDTLFNQNKLNKHTKFDTIKQKYTQTILEQSIDEKYPFNYMNYNDFSIISPE